MPDDKKTKPTEEKPKEQQETTSKRVDRFIYTKEDVAHIFRLGKIGTVFNDTDSN